MRKNPKTFWTLCLSRMPRQKKVRIGIEPSTKVPAKGEVKQILGLFKERAHAETVRKQMRDKFLLLRWGRFLFLEYRDGRVYMVGEKRMSEIVDEFCGEG